MTVPPQPPAEPDAKIRTRNTVTIPRSNVPRDEGKEAIDSRLPSRYEVRGLNGDPDSLEVHDQHGWSVHPWFVPVCAQVEVQITRPRSSDTEIHLYPVGKDISHGLVRRVRRLLEKEAPELRAGPQQVVVEPMHPIPDNLVSLLSVYATQFGSYTTLLWQVPALGLTAQAFLLTIALGGMTSKWARIMASVLSIIIALASAFLMHNQRGRAINHGELLRRLSEKLSLKSFLGGSFELDDATPEKTNAQDVWAVDHFIYHGWMWCMYLFAVADVVIIISTSLNLSWF